MKLSVIDSHCDTAYELFLRGENIQNNTCHISLDGFSAYDRKAQFFAIWSDRRYSDDECFERFLKAADNFRSDVQRHSDEISLASDADGFATAWESGKLAAILAVEDARLLGKDLSRLDVLKAYGVKYLTLTWSGDSCIGGAHDTDAGLSDFGRRVVERCFELSIIPDVSHGSEALTDEVISLAYQYKKPIIASHSNSYFSYPHSRNLRDGHFADIKTLGGLVGVSLCPHHLGNAASRAITVLDVIKHIDRYMELGGEDTVGLGCDLDGTDLPEGFDGVSNLYLIADELAKNGYSDRLINKIFWQNHYNFLLKSM
ncbi:MAG: hypothetical protein E7589_06380 [Ruminococcaceae bacterium]|nr:hypothetical protein [Oscillospiraceae bacterium]